MATTPRKRRTRLSHDERRAAILEQAVDFFSRRGPSGSTRDLAAEAGVSVALIHKYFSKDDLLDSVYQHIFMSRVDPDWISFIGDGTVDLRARLVAFYEKYVAAVDDPVWVRVSLQTALDGETVSRRYLDEYVSRIIDAVALACRQGGDEKPISTLERRRAWVLHSSVVFFLVCKHLHGMPGDSQDVIETSVDVFLSGVLQNDRKSAVSSTERPQKVLSSRSRAAREPAVG